MPPVKRKRHESGYALLMVFLLSASIAIGLYEVAPRVAFESQRDKEQLLVDRGEQYKRAVQLYYRKFRKYPVKMEDLENTSNTRFLRKRYVDPMTGKDEWRLIHVGPGGQFIDSLTQKKTTQKQDTSSANTFIAEFKSVADPADAVDQLSPALRRRPSDQAAANGATLGGDGNGMAAPVDPNNPNPDPNLNAGAFPPGGAVPGGGMPGTGDGSGAPPNPTGYVPGGEMPLSMQQQLQQQQLQQLQSGQPGGVIGPNGSLMPAGYTSGGGPAAIQQLLTSPRPGGPPPGIFNPSGRPMNDYGFTDPNGNNLPNSYNPGATTPNIPTPSNPQPVSAMPGAGGAFGGNSFGGSAFGGANPAVGPGGIGSSPVGTPVQGSGGGNFATGSFAGVASTVQRRGIKKYADYSKYNEWEFIYDYSKDVAKAAGIPVNGAVGANGNTSINGQQSPFGNNAGSNIGNSPGSTLGGASGAGGNNTNGSTGTITPTSPTSN